jgi:hypothetical protein
MIHTIASTKITQHIATDAADEMQDVAQFTAAQPLLKILEKSQRQCFVLG